MPSQVIDVAIFDRNNAINTILKDLGTTLSQEKLHFESFICFTFYDKHLLVISGASHGVIVESMQVYISIGDSA